jgi:ferredoxin
MLYIDPNECIGCGACITECPVEAIFDVADVPAQWQPFIALNAERAVTLKPGGNITQKQEPLVSAGCKGGGS